MKKEKEEGFAISTMLYGLLIISALITFMLLGIISFNQKSNSDFVDTVEKELLEFAENHNYNICGVDSDSSDTDTD